MCIRDSLYSAAICLGIQWLAWIPASLAKSERYYDLTGGLTYLTVVGFTLWAGSQSESPSARELIVSLLVVIWALRLSSFLYLRIIELGKMEGLTVSKPRQSDFSCRGPSKGYGYSSR